MREPPGFPIPGDRRSFLKAGAAAALLPAWFVEECRSQDKPAPSSSPNERPHIALIGCGGRGRGIAQEASRLSDVIAVCDVDARHAEEVSKQFKGAKIYKDFRKLLERKDVDAILNGTPDHWHTLINPGPLHLCPETYSSRSAASRAVRPANCPCGISDTREGRSSSTFFAAKTISLFCASRNTTSFSLRLTSRPVNERPSAVCTR